LDPKVICCPESTDGYRNKVEFTVGRPYAGPDAEASEEEIIVGFNRGNLAKGISFVDKPDEIRVNSKESLVACKRFETIVQQSELEPYDRTTNSGFWRIFLYRESKTTK